MRSQKGPFSKSVESQCEDGTLVGYGAHTDCGIMLEQYLAREAESYAGSLPVRSKERDEDFSQGFFGDSDSIIFNRDYDCVFRAQ